MKFLDVVDDFLSSLSAEKKLELEVLLLNHQIEASWPWYEVVISRYLVTPESFQLIREIEDLFPDESALKLIEATSNAPVFEARMILREAQRVARERLGGAPDRA